MNKFKGVGIGTNFHPVSTIIQLGKIADDNGLDYILIQEMPNDRSAIIRAAAVASTTKRIKIGIGVLSPYTRHLSSIAADAISLDELSQGRFMLGLGAPVEKMKAINYDISSFRPLRDLRVAFTLLKEFVTGSPTSIDSPLFGITKGMTIGEIPPNTQIPIFLGVVNKRMIQMAGEIADFIELGALNNPGYIRWAMSHLEQGAKLSNRSMKEYDVYGHALVCLDKDPERARELARPLMAWYLSFIEEVIYLPMGITVDEVAKVKQTYYSKGLTEATKHVTEDMINKLGSVGTVEDVITGLKRYLGTGLTHINLWGPFGHNIVDAVNQLAQEVLPHLPRV